MAKKFQCIGRNVLQTMFFQNVAAKLNKAFQLEMHIGKIISRSKMRPSLHCQEEFPPKLWCPAGPQEKAFCAFFGAALDDQCVRIHRSEGSKCTSKHDKGNGQDFEGGETGKVQTPVVFRW